MPLRRDLPGSKVPSSVLPTNMKSFLPIIKLLTLGHFTVFQKLLMQNGRAKLSKPVDIYNF
jgi:hypothetical protein